jgi:phage tail-like protein
MATNYPPVGFHFIVTFDIPVLADGNVPFIHAQEVKGLQVSVEPETVQEGGENLFQHRLPSKITYSNLTISRGTIIGSAMIEWVKLATEHFIFVPQNINVILLDENHLPIDTWRFINAWPAKLSVSDLSGQDGKLLVETIEFTYQYFTRGLGSTAGAIISALQSKGVINLNQIFA